MVCMLAIRENKIYRISCITVFAKISYLLIIEFIKKSYPFWHLLLVYNTF